MLPSPADPPPGLLLEDAFLSPAEERDLLALFEDVAFEDVVLHGRPARRTVAHFGYRYRYDTGEVDPGPPIPEELARIRRRAASLAGVPADALVEALVTRYPPGATIGWHRDAPAFGRVVGVSLGASCRMRFRRRTGDRWIVHEELLAPRSAYALTGTVRAAWQHSIPPVGDLRHSVTFRTVRRPPPGAPDGQ